MNFEEIYSFEKHSIIALSSNFTGSRLAVATSDNSISFFSFDPEDKTFNLDPFSKVSLNFQINQIRFPPLEYGSLLGVSDKNGTLHLLEERIDTKIKNKKEWFIIYSFNFSFEKINDFEFSPSTYGYNLAIGTSFGMLRVYQCLDKYEFQEWILTAQETFTTNIQGIKSISWCKNPFNPSVLAVAYDYDRYEKNNKFTNSEIAIYIVNGDSSKILEKLPKQKNYSIYSDDIEWAPSFGKTSESIVSCGRDGIFLWSFLIEEGEIKIKNKDKINGSEVEEMEIFSKNVSWSANSSILLDVKTNQNEVYLLKEINEGNWQYVYRFKNSN